ncbi:MAG: peptide ABC transporter substrate-binding protein [Proteobacteria bacterium]|nr:peptide ABC transporter substrate-binding protein [Pseudomonadota bacterium]
MKKSIKSLLLLFLVAAILPLSTAFANKGEFIILNGAEPQGLDFAKVSGVPEHQIYFSLGEGLVATDPNTAKAVPGVAKSWKISNGGKTYTFSLRKTTWSDGVPITAHTFVDSWLRILNPKTAARYAWFPSMFIEGAGDYNGGKAGPEAVKIRAIDDYTFEVNLVGPLPYTLDALAHYAFSISPLHVIKKYPKTWTNPENFVSNGPFMLEKWEPQKQLTAVPSPTYWDKANVHLERVIYIPSDDNNTRYNMFVNGEADWLHSHIPLDQIADAEMRDEYQSGPYLGTYYYNIQNEKKPFNDVKVRKALSLSINRKHIVEKITKAGETAAYSMVPPMAGYDPSEGEHENLDRARTLLAQAGFPNGQGFPAFEILYNTSEAHKKIAEYVQQQWSENLGLKVSLKNQEWKTYLNTTRAHDFTIARAGWIGDYNDPNTFLDMFVTGAGMNRGLYSNAGYDTLIKAAATMAEGPERMKVLKEAEYLFLQKDQHLIPIYGYVSQNMIDLNKWGGWGDNVMDWHPTKTIHLK